MKIWTVDAFASQPYTGNPAAVTIVDEFPPDELCLKIAAEMNLSETVFVKPLKDGTFHIRWFTPAVEVKLCGHGTLAAAHILFQTMPDLKSPLAFSSLSGPLFVTDDSNGITLNFPLQETESQLPAEGLIEVLELEESVKHVVKAGPDIIAELENPNELRHLSLNSKDILKLDCRDLIVTSKGDGPYDFISRVFAPRDGIDEDPVTGSAHCKLAHYWQQRLKKESFLAYQASKRGGEIHIDIQGDRVLLKGKALTIMEGNWLV